jgi:hypothetical protein
MPSQKPLIDLDQLDRNRGEQLKAIDGLAARLQPGIARDGYSVSVQALVSLMTRFDSLTSPQRPYTWHGIAHWSGMTGLSPKQCSRAISVLQSLQLIEARVTWVSHGKRGMKIRINWSTVFTTGPITQDAEDLALWTARKTRQRTLFATRRTPKQTPVVSVSETDTMSTTETDIVSVSERDMVSVSTICNPQTYSPIQSAGSEGVDERSFQSSAVSHQQENDDVTTGTGSQGINPQPHVRLRDAFGSGGERGGTDVFEQRHPDHGCDCETPQSARFNNHTRVSAVPPSDLIRDLIALDVADARSAVKKSLTAGYSIDQIRAIVDWYQREALPDEAGKLVYPYTPGQLVMRLRDRDAVDAEPAQGNWQGGKSGFWTRLAPISTPKPRKQAPERPATHKPDRIAVSNTYTTTLSLSEIQTAMDAHHAPPMVRQSAGRMREGEMGRVGELPKTLARWMKAVGLPVEESQQGGGN